MLGSTGRAVQLGLEHTARMTLILCKACVSLHCSVFEIGSVKGLNPRILDGEMKSYEESRGFMYAWTRALQKDSLTQTLPLKSEQTAWITHPRKAHSIVSLAFILPPTLGRPGPSCQCAIVKISTAELSSVCCVVSHGASLAEQMQHFEGCGFITLYLHVPHHSLQTAICIHC